MNIYLDNGYIDWERVDAMMDKNGIPFCAVVGNRGCGKTFGCIKRMREQGNCFMFLRRLAAQIDILSNPEFSPYTKVGDYIGEQYLMSKVPGVKNISAQYLVTGIDEDGKPETDPLPFSYMAALSTFSNVRGFNADAITHIIWDEFIPERHERPIKDESDAFFNMYETINRNRELEGRPPVRCYMLANANDLGNPMFMALGLVKVCLDMRRKDQDLYLNKEKGIAVLLLKEGAFAEQKKTTALYRLTAGTEFYDMAIGNTFAEEKHVVTVSRPLAEYDPIVTFAEVTAYRHKSNGSLYFSPHRKGSPPVYTTSDADRERFSKNYGFLWLCYLNDRIEFEEYSCELVFRKFFKTT